MASLPSHFSAATSPLPRGIIQAQASPQRGKRRNPISGFTIEEAEDERLKFMRCFTDGIDVTRVKGRSTVSVWEKVADKLSRDGGPAQPLRDTSRAPVDAAYWCGAFPWDNEVRRRNQSVQSVRVLIEADCQIPRFTFGNQGGFRPNQLETINAVLSKRDVFLVMPTGGGKSLCYQIPALVNHEARRGGTTVVICPLVSLILDQEAQLSQCGILCAGLSSSAAHTMPPVETFKKLFSGKLRVLFVTPERLSASKRLLDLLAGLYKNSLLHGFVIDEAHCVSQWGHDFREDYLLLANIRKTFPGVPILAMTATAKPDVMKDIMLQLGMPTSSTVVIRTSLNRTNISYSVVKRPSKGKMLESLAGKIRELSGKDGRGSGIIYCMSKKDCEQVSTGLRAYSIKAAVYHADLPQSIRDANQKLWMDNEIQVMAATVAFGMGINKRDVRFVIHYSMPKTLEAFYQESGRAGRDGRPSYSVIYYDYYSKNRNQWLIEQGGDRSRAGISTHARHELIGEQKKSLLALVAYCESSTQCRRIILLKYLGTEAGPVATCLDSNSLPCDVCIEQQQAGLGGSSVLEARCEAEAMAIVSLCEEAVSRGIKPTLCSLKDAAIGSTAKSLLPAWRSLPSFACLASNEPPFTGPLVLSLLRAMVVEGVLAEEVVSIGMHGTFAAYVRVGERSACSRVAIVRRESKRSKKTPRSTRRPQWSSPGSGRAGRREWEARRALLETRKKLSELNGIMRADAVFSDAVVEECIQMMPTTLEQLCQVQGLGEFRVEAYGPAILEALAGLSEDPQPTRFDSDDTESRTALDMPSLGKESRAIPDCRTVTGQQEVQCATRIGQSHVRSERDNSGKSKRSELFAFQDVALAAWRSDSGGSFFPNRELLSNRQLEPSPLPMRAEAVTPAEGAPKRRVGFYDHLFDGLF